MDSCIFYFFLNNLFNILARKPGYYLNNVFGLVFLMSILGFVPFRYMHLKINFKLN